MAMYSSYKSPLLKSLRERADPKAKRWWEGYVKDSAPFLGVKMANVRSVVHQWHKNHIGGILALEEQVGLALKLFEGEHTEEKLAGMLFLQEILLPADALRCDRDVGRFAELFNRGYIYDWNICDWFCVKVLGPLIIKDGERCARGISNWNAAQNLWQARASLVAFVPVAEKSEYYLYVESACQTVIRRQERFAKTAVGWILRDISKHDRELVKRVATENIDHFSVESLKNATKYFSEEEKRIYLKMLKEV